MRYEPAVSIVPANADIVRSVLFDARLIPEWNESIASVTGPPDIATDASYDMTIRTGVRGHLQFSLVAPDRLEFRWEVPDLREYGRWDLEALGPTTRVAHVVRRHGALAIPLRRARRELPQRRLARLAIELGKVRSRAVGMLS